MTGRRLRVASVARIASIGGDENRLLQTALSRDPSRVDQCVLIIDPEEGLSERERGRWADMRRAYADAGVEVVDLCGAPVAVAARLRNELRRRRIDVLDARMGRPVTLGLPAARAAGVPVATFTTYYTSLFDPPFRYLVGQAVVAGVDAIISDARATLDDFERWRWSPRAELALIRNGILPVVSTLRRDQARAALGLPDTPGLRIVGQVSRVIPRKAFDVFLRAARLAVDVEDDLAFAAVGFVAEDDRAHHEELLALRDELGLRDHVHFLAHPGPVGDVYAALDVFAHLSYADSSPFAIHESMSAGMPSVISALPGNRELVDDGATGLLVPAGDAAAAAAAMLRLVRDPALADRLGRAAADRFVERHQPHQMAAAHLELWERLLRAKGVDLGAHG